MNMNEHLVVNYSEQFVASCLASAEQLRYGNGSRATAMIGAMATAVRRAAAAVEQWARGCNTNLAESGLPRLRSAR